MPNVFGVRVPEVVLREALEVEPPVTSESSTSPNPRRVQRYFRDPAFFLEHEWIRPETGKPIKLLPHQKRILRHVFHRDKNGRFAYDTVVWSAPKKSGKTEIGAGVTLWFALFSGETPNEIYCIANDLEQARSRAFTRISKIVKLNPAIAARLRQFSIEFSTGTFIKAISNDYAGAAGGNQGLTLWDELWGYESEASHRLWEEMTPVPTRRNSLRFITTYAGFLGQSRLLWELYTRGVGPEEYEHGRGEKIPGLEDLPCWRNERLFVYWDHEPRMPWQTPEYYQAQRAQLRPSAFARLHENRWVTGETTFVPVEWWDECVKYDAPPPREWRPVVIGVDAATKRDTAAVVGVGWDTSTNQPVVLFHKTWEPRAGEPVDLSVVEQFLKDTAQVYDVHTILYDPFQFARSAAVLAAAGLPMEEFPQTTERTTDMSSALYNALKERKLIAYASDEIRYALSRTSAAESIRGVRIARRSHTQKIDVVVALAMAVHGATRYLALESAPTTHPSDIIVGGVYTWQQSQNMYNELTRPWE
jgi:phage terminase large subunit-like protein